MNNILNWFTRKRLIWVSFVSSFTFLFLTPRGVLSKVCPTNNSFCIDSFNYVLLILMFGVMTFLFSTVMFFMKDYTFESWKKTTFIYLFIYLL